VTNPISLPSLLLLVRSSYFARF